jgi:hypothetical protein
MSTIESRADVRRYLDERFRDLGLRPVMKGQVYNLDLPDGFWGQVRVNYSGRGQGAGVTPSYGISHEVVQRMVQRLVPGWNDLDPAYSAVHLAIDPSSNGGVPLWAVEFGGSDASFRLESVVQNYQDLGLPWMRAFASWPRLLELTDDATDPVTVWSHPLVLLALGRGEEAVRWARATSRYAADGEYRVFAEALAEPGSPL